MKLKSLRRATKSMAQEFFKVASNGQWSLGKNSVPKPKDTSGKESPMKAKLFSLKEKAGQKLQAQGAKIEAIRQLKAKNPKVDWDEKLAASLREIQTLLKATWEEAPHIKPKDCTCGATGTKHHYSCVDKNPHPQNRNAPIKLKSGGEVIPHGIGIDADGHVHHDNYTDRKSTRLN